jgi:hypothetical protein
MSAYIFRRSLDDSNSSGIKYDIQLFHFCCACVLSLLYFPDLPAGVLVMLCAARGRAHRRIGATDRRSERATRTQAQTRGGRKAVCRHGQDCQTGMSGCFFDFLPRALCPCYLHLIFGAACNRFIFLLASVRPSSLVFVDCLALLTVYLCVYYALMNPLEPLCAGPHIDQSRAPAKVRPSRQGDTVRLPPVQRRRVLLGGDIDRPQTPPPDGPQRRLLCGRQPRPERAALVHGLCDCHAKMILTKYRVISANNTTRKCCGT